MDAVCDVAEEKEVKVEEEEAAVEEAEEDEEDCCFLFEKFVLLLGEMLDNEVCCAGLSFINSFNVHSFVVPFANATVNVLLNTFQLFTWPRIFFLLISVRKKYPINEEALGCLREGSAAAGELRFSDREPSCEEPRLDSGDGTLGFRLPKLPKLPGEFDRFIAWHN